MQTKLSQRAEEDKSKEFKDLYNLLYDEKWLLAAQKHVRQNAGSKAAGCDGMTRRMFEEDLVLQW